MIFEPRPAVLRAGTVIRETGTIILGAGTVDLLAGIIASKAGTIISEAGIFISKTGTVTSSAGTTILDTGTAVFFMGTAVSETILAASNLPTGSLPEITAPIESHLTEIRDDFYVIRNKLSPKILVKIRNEIDIAQVRIEKQEKNRGSGE